MIGVVSLVASLALTVQPAPATVASHYSGKQQAVVCKPMTATYGYTNLGAPVVWLRADLCQSLASGVGDAGFAVALQVLLHESFHQRFSAQNESVPECSANLAFPDALERFYGVPVGSTESERLWTTALNFSRAAHPGEAQDCSRLWVTA